MIIFCLVLTLAVQLKGNELPTRVTVEITNGLTKKVLSVHCKDKNNNLGFVELDVGQTFSFRFYPNYFLPRTLYFCYFQWIGVGHSFDIYVQKRDDYCSHNRCSWVIAENGPCMIKPLSRECFKWNPAIVASPPV